LQNARVPRGRGATPRRDQHRIDATMPSITHRLAARAALLLALAPAAAAAQRAAPAPAALLDTAIARMGGAAALRGIERARFEMLTQWQRTAFTAHPYADQPSYETHTDSRDYAIPAWRNVRRFPSPAPTGVAWREITDLVRDTVAVRRMPAGPGGPAVAAGTVDGWSPLNVAYVDERRELFAFAPERVLLLARAAADLRALPDTTIAGVAHARVAATVEGFPATLFLRRSDGFPAMARYRAAHPNDFGLAPWGTMEVELWWSAWRPLPGGIVYPMQTDTRRVGRPYKRVTVLAATFGAAIPADSLAVSDTLRALYAATATRPMHDLPLDSARIVEGRLASFGAFGAPAGAVRLGRAWVLLEAGQAPLNAERAAAWLARADSGSRVAAAIVTAPMTGSGGAAWLARQRLEVHAGTGSAPFVATVLRGHGEPTSAMRVTTSGRWLRVDGDSLRLETLDLPDAPGSLVAYVPSLEWMYGATLASPVHRDLALAHARALGWRVSRIGHVRAVSVPAPAASPARAAAGGAAR
jgi:hypothetical protein